MGDYEKILARAMRFYLNIQKQLQFGIFLGFNGFGKPEEASKMFARLTQIDLVTLRLSITLESFEQNKPEEAIEAYNKAIELNIMQKPK